MTKEDIQRWERSTEQIGQINTQLEGIKVNTENTCKEVGKLSVIVTGNGEPEKGLFNQFQSLKSCVEFHHNGVMHPTKDDITQAVKEAIPQPVNGHKDSKWISAETKDFIIKWFIRGGIGLVAGKSMLDLIPK